MGDWSSVIWSGVVVVDSAVVGDPGHTAVVCGDGIELALSIEAVGKAKSALSDYDRASVV